MFLFFYVGVVFAQTYDQTVPQAGTDQEISEPEITDAIPIVEISKRAQETHIVLNKIRANLKPVADILTIKEQLPSFSYTLKRLRSGGAL